MTAQYRTRTDGTIVPPKSADDIALIANAVREALNLTAIPYFPVVKVFEYLPHLVDGADFEVLAAEEMGDDHGRTYPDQSLIRIREDVYEGAYSGQPRDRFTMCHELGHLIMHKSVALSRIDPANPPKIYFNSEWQADKFASYLLMPKHLLRNYLSVDQVVKEFGVSWEAAMARKQEMKGNLSCNSNPF